MIELQPLMEKMVSQYPWLSAAMFWIAGARMLLKWVSGPIQSRLTEAMVRLAGDTEGDALVHRILKNPVYRVAGFALDLTCSWKLPTHATFTAAMPPCEPPAA